MSSALCSNLSREDFLAWAEGQDARYEFDGDRPVAVTGGTNNHGGFLIDRRDTGRIARDAAVLATRPASAD